ncbi:MSHA biogenesis protein MshP [Shewanella sp. 10N.286.52.B9]|uniref:MSHA biogenesis protein MshP n=1 Tax=Shewanella sp. 10N.286.52.B9 TaxID=1880837 RepID=UPI000C828F06|nr:MSHA biogenesis protein MshP [Shewanella sp. 10N.286.52.B9]PMG42769.1 MSHA biogenesis protein MshP [Shewanella sp. 10N.286.52.B9]
MFHNSPKNTSSLNSGLMATRQRGSALVIAIFVLIVMFLLAGTLIRMLEDGDDAVNLEVWGARALFAANSGADAELASLFPVAGGVGVCNSVRHEWSAPSTIGFHGCRVFLACNPTVANGVTQYSILSYAVCETGNCSGDAATTDCLRVNRQVEVEARGD